MTTTALTLWAAQYPEAAAALRAITVPPAPTGGTTSENEELRQ